MDRRNLKPWLRKCPQWLLVVLIILCFPVYLLLGILTGINEGVGEWLVELKEMASPEQEQGYEYE